jgi:hypothetical protein
MLASGELVAAIRRRDRSSRREAADRKSAGAGSLR